MINKETKSISKSVRLKPTTFKYIDEYKGASVKCGCEHSFNNNLEDIMNDFIGNEQITLSYIEELKEEIKRLDEDIKQRKEIIMQLDDKIYDQLNKKMQSIKNVVNQFSRYSRHY